MGHMKSIHSLYHSIELRNDELEYFDKVVKDAIDSGKEVIYYKNNADGTQFKRPKGS